MCGTSRVSWYQKKHSPTNINRGHQSSLICFLHLLQSTASSLFNVQYFSTISIQVFFHLPLGLAPSTSYSILFYTQTSCSFYSTFCCSTEIMSSNPSLFLNPLLGIVSCSLMPHIHLTILISDRWSAAAFSFLMGQVSIPCNILLCTQLLYNLPFTHTHTQPFCGPLRFCPGPPGWAGTRKVKPER